MVVGLHRQHQAGTHRQTIEQHGTGAADAMLAADMGACERQIVAQEIAEQHARFDAAPILHAVHPNRDIVVVSVRHRALAGLLSSAPVR
jgi:hypothetical protein